ncbi:MAG TPA: hypothetical protein VI603_16400 [Saprospiraceae bacterium]|nr:hypothetical protein [Saprospiraceae bacterium]
MKTSMFSCRNPAIIILSLCIPIQVSAQLDSILMTRIAVDTSGQKLNMDATYNRPFLSTGKMPIALGGYVEANTQYASTDGISEGLSFQFRRLTIFLSSTIAKRIKFLSEIEFEDGAKEINVEYAAMDIELHPLLNFRGGIIVNPIGSFNQNHDGPKWDFIDRPISATTLIPSTLSNVGIGLHGKYFAQNWIVGYETYLTNGFDDKIISNKENRTSLAAGKSSPEKFEESNSGRPMFTGKIAVRNREIGELGISYMTGIYNKWREDGLIIDSKRDMHVVAIDFNSALAHNRFTIVGEVAKVFVDVPETYSQAYGSRQFGGFIDFVGTVVKRKVFEWENAKFNLALRLEYADYNQGEFNETGGNIADDIWAIVPGIAFRPVGTTVLRFNYRYQRQQDLLGNPHTRTGIVQFGFSSYF